MPVFRKQLLLSKQHCLLHVLKIFTPSSSFTHGIFLSIKSQQIRAKIKGCNYCNETSSAQFAIISKHTHAHTRVQVLASSYGTERTASWWCLLKTYRVITCLWNNGKYHQYKNPKATVYKKYLTKTKWKTKWKVLEQNTA